MTRAKKNNEIKVDYAMQFASGDVGFQLTYNGVKLYRMTRKTGTDDEGEYYWFAFPSYKGKDGKYWKYYYVDFTEEEQDLINDKIDELLK